MSGPQPKLKEPSKEHPSGNSSSKSRAPDYKAAASETLNEYRDQMPTALARRDGNFGKAGKKAMIEVNSHAVLSWPQKDVYQYDIMIGSGAEKRGLITAVWNSQAIQTKLGDGFIFDGNKIGWSPKDLGELRIMVDLDEEKKKEPRKGRENTHRVRIAKTKRIHLSVVQDYLDGRTNFNEGILETINFLDHLLREGPSKNLINLRRSYFSRVGANTDRVLVGGGVEAMRGAYQTIRMAEGKRLVVNVDVSNSCFWQESLFTQIGMELTGQMDMVQFIQSCIVSERNRNPRAITILKRLVRNKFKIKHRGQLPGADAKLWTVKRISHLNAKTHEFDVFDKTTGKTTKMSVFSYYQKKYNVRLDKWQLPLLETQKREVYFPMELAIMAPAQRYPFKLNEKQTANMIKFAVAKPPVRRQGIRDGLKLLNWQGDTMLKGYGLRIDPNMIKTSARVLDPPEVQFKGSTAKPLYSGRWDLRGKVFAEGNIVPLKSWAIVILKHEGHGPGITVPQVENFRNKFLDLYRSHGGNVVERNPVIISGVPDNANALNSGFQQAGNRSRFRPQMIMVIMPAKNVDTYQRVKKNCDIRFGVMSQCVQAANVIKAAPQYCSNVLMKFNCKLGGTTSTVKARTNYFTGPTMIIGADVSHAAPGLEQASMAAMTFSLDRTCSRYGAAVQSNGKRVEMISSANIEYCLETGIKWWRANVGQGRLPKHVYYFRDGVSEGQYIPLLKWEVADIKDMFLKEVSRNKDVVQPKFTVVVAEKRHHIRFFPPQGIAADKNANPVPGVIVDRDVTQPFENDIYLCSHAAIQGTARPTHYTIIMDEMKVPVDVFQAMLYDHCYQYQRATTPVSLFPAVYYAHLASKRAEAHIDQAEIDRRILSEERRKHPGQEHQPHSEEMARQSDWPPLLSFEPSNNIGMGMWYI